MWVCYGSNVASDIPISFPAMLWGSLTLKVFVVYELTHQERAAAIADLTKMLKDNALRHTIGAHYTLGKITLQDGQIDVAVTQLERCVRADPRNKGAHYQLARAYRLQGEAAKADAELAAFRALGAANTADAAPGDNRLERIGPSRAKPSPHR